MSEPGKQLSPIEDFRRTVNLLDGQIKAALPPHITVDRFKRVLLTAVQHNPDILTLERPSLLGAVLRSAQDGLLPDGREGAIVKFGGKAQWIAMVAGIMKKVRNSGEIATWSLQVVKDNDSFDFQFGDEEKITHKPALKNRGETVGAYSIVTFKSGEKSREWMTVEEIEKIRNRSRAKDNGPWKTDYDEMCKKTVCRRHSKKLPMSTDIDGLVMPEDDIVEYDGAELKAVKMPDATVTQAKQTSSRLSDVIEAQEETPMSQGENPL